MIGTPILVKRIGQTRVEWALLTVIALVCAVLLFLQYRWTGELSRAEPALLRAGLNEQLRRLTRAFNNDIRETCTTLLPDANEIRVLGTVEAHRIRDAQWVSSHDRSLFTRIEIVALSRENSRCTASTMAAELLRWIGRRTGSLFARRWPLASRAWGGPRTPGKTRT
jgi:hypothetical protein